MRINGSDGLNFTGNLIRTAGNLASGGGGCLMTILNSLGIIVVSVAVLYKLVLGIVKL